MLRRLRERNPRGDREEQPERFSFGRRQGNRYEGSNNWEGGRDSRNSRHERRGVSRGGKGRSSGDREFAYEPPAHRETGEVYEWQPPVFKEILKDLGLRLLERGISAAALAVGEEIAYFFSKRRFYTQEQKDKRDYR